MTADEMSQALNNVANSFSIEHYQTLVGELRLAVTARVEAERLRVADQAPDDIGGNIYEVI